MGLAFVEEQVFGSMEALEGVTQLVADVGTAFFLDHLHLLGVVEERVHRVVVQRPAVDMRVNTVLLGRSVEERLALLPVVTHGAPGLAGFAHQRLVVGLAFDCRLNGFAFLQQHQTFAGHIAVGLNDRVVYIRRHDFLQRFLFVGVVNIHIAASDHRKAADSRHQNIRNLSHIPLLFN